MPEPIEPRAEPSWVPGDELDRLRRDAERPAPSGAELLERQRRLDPRTERRAAEERQRHGEA